ncbi:hypothetical protein Hdeb2414_s0008g00281011 [Helianthus debilis subsp. tardiflorus]
MTRFNTSSAKLLVNSNEFPFAIHFVNSQRLTKQFISRYRQMVISSPFDPFYLNIHFILVGF